MKRLPAMAAFAFGSAILACRGGAAHPSKVDRSYDVCRSCRMPVSDPKLAAQIAAPGEDAIFFDDIGCLRDWLERGPQPHPGAVAYVADHRSGRWIRAADARFLRCPAVETPMGSHLIADGDPAAPGENAVVGCSAVSASELFGSGGPPQGRTGVRP